ERCVLRYQRVEIREHDHAFLRSRLIADTDENGRRLSTIHRDVWHLCRNEEIVSWARNLSVFEVITCAQFDFFTAHKVESGLVVVMKMRLGATLRGERDHTEKNDLGANGLGTDPRCVRRALFAHVAG